MKYMWRKAHATTQALKFGLKLFSFELLIQAKRRHVGGRELEGLLRRSIEGVNSPDPLSHFYMEDLLRASTYFCHILASNPSHARPLNA